MPQDIKEIEELKIIQHDRQIKLSELKLQQLQIELEMKKVELELQKYNSVNLDDIEGDKAEENDSDSSDTDEEIQHEITVKEEPNYIKPRINGAKIPKIYQYNPDDIKTPINIYDSPSELERKLNYISLPALKRASQNNTIYKNYRWFYVNRNEPPPEQISETIVTKFKSPEIRFIAMIDIKKTKILAVYASQKEAVEARNMKCNSFTRAIQQQHISSGHYWNFFDDCSNEMKIEYLKNNMLPEKLLSPIGVKIQKIDPITKNIIAVYNTKRDIVKKYQISHAKLNQLISNDALEEVYNGFIWKSC
jgi:hypothetical protein